MVLLGYLLTTGNIDELNVYLPQECLLDHRNLEGVRISRKPSLNFESEIEASATLPHSPQYTCFSLASIEQIFTRTTVVRTIPWGGPFLLFLHTPRSHGGQGVKEE